jgi:hypothetical protein
MEVDQGIRDDSVVVDPCISSPVARGLGLRPLVSVSLLEVVEVGREPSQCAQRSIQAGRQTNTAATTGSSASAATVSLVAPLPL